MRWLRSPALAVVAVQAIDVVAQTAAGIIAARALGPERLAPFSFGFGVAGLLSIFLLFGSGEAALVAYARTGPAALSPVAVLHAAARAWLRGTVSVAGLGTLIATGLMLHGSLDGFGAAVLAGSLVILAINGLGSVFNHAIVGKGAAARDLPNTLVSRGLLLLGTVAAGFAPMALAVPVLLAAHFTAAVVLVALRARLVHRALFPLGPVDARALAEARETLSRTARHIGGGAVFGTISARSDTVFLEAFAAPAQLGLYSAVYRLINGIAAVNTAFATALFPAVARLFNGEPTDTATLYRRVTTLPLKVRLLPVGMAAAALVAAGLSGPIVGLVYGDKYAAAAPVLAILLVAASLQTVFAFSSRLVVAAGRASLLPWAQGAAAATGLALNLLLIPTQGASGAALATLGCELVGVIILGALLLRPEQRSHCEHELQTV
jgi:O-antigen/teichoic acid export membrane protein